MRNMIQAVSTLGLMTMAATPLAAVGGMAHAQERDAVSIRTSDLDLATPAAQAIFDRRVASAADAMCRPPGPAELARVAACERSFRDEARAQLQRLRTSDGRPPAWTVALR